MKTTNRAIILGGGKACSVCIVSFMCCLEAIIIYFIRSIDYARLYMHAFIEEVKAKVVTLAKRLNDYRRVIRARTFISCLCRLSFINIAMSNTFVSISLIHLLIPDVRLWSGNFSMILAHCLRPSR